MLKSEQRKHDAQLIASTLRVQQEQAFDITGEKQTIAIAAPPSDRYLFKPRRCYVCKCLFHKVDIFYHALCEACAEKNTHKRHSSAPLNGYKALVTGGRIKIGFETALKLLRAGAKVLVTTRFVHDAAKRFRQQTDYARWEHRLTLYPLDLKHLPSVEAFVQHLLDEGEPLDIVINNAAQTLRKPTYYFTYMAHNEHLLENKTPKKLLSGFSDTMLKQEQTQLRIEGPGTISLLDEHNEPLDLSERNSWSLSLDEVEPLEMVEVMIINATSPGILCARLKPLMKLSSHSHKFIVNVSSMEGQFSRENKTHRHPHTNMAKAALNMLTRTSAKDYAKDGIYMTSVDTGWVTEEHPFHIRQQLRERGVVPPLDSIDGAARVLDPIFSAINGARPDCGVFLKDYSKTQW